MGKYWNPGRNPTIEDMESVGRWVEPMAYEEMAAMCVPGETLAMFNDRGVFTQCAEIPHRREYDQFMGATRQMISYSFWIVPKSIFARTEKQS